MHRFLTYLLLLICLSGCQSTSSYNAGFGTFQRSLNTKEYGYQKLTDPTGRAPTEIIERFEVRFGDCSSDQRWSDCKNDRERSEMSGPKDNLVGSEWWYGWSIYLPPTFVVVQPVSTVFGQFHQKNKPIPSFQFRNDGGGLYLSRDLHASQHWSTILSHEEMLGKWNHLEVHAKWSPKSDGFFKVYANGVLKNEYRGPTTYAQAVYFKYGIYRTHVSRYLEKFGVEAVPTQVVFYANVRRAKTKESLNGN